MRRPGACRRGLLAAAAAGPCWACSRATARRRAAARLPAVRRPQPARAPPGDACACWWSSSGPRSASAMAREGELDARRQRAHVREPRERGARAPVALRAKDVRLGRPCSTRASGTASPPPSTPSDLPSAVRGARPARRAGPALLRRGRRDLRPRRSMAVGSRSRRARFSCAPGRDESDGAPRLRPSRCSTRASTSRHPDLRGRVARGYDAVGRDPDPSVAPGGGAATSTAPRSRACWPTSSRERSGSSRARGRAAARRRAGGRDEFGTTDQLLAGLERTVDPDGDGDVADARARRARGRQLALRGLRRLARGRGRGGGAPLGTLVVAPAGNEGRARAATSARSARPAPRRPCWPSPRSRATAPALPAVALGLARRGRTA